MKLPAGMLVVIAAVVLVGCPKREGAPMPNDAGRSASEQTAASSGAITPGPRVTNGAEATDAGSAGHGESHGADAGGGSEAACVDRWLEARDLDTYGHPAGTMYTGGTPLFNERTGERTDRLQYVYKRHPEARQACAGGVTQ